MLTVILPVVVLFVIILLPLPKIGVDVRNPDCWPCGVGVSVRAGNCTGCYSGSHRWYRPDCLGDWAFHIR